MPPEANFESDQGKLDDVDRIPGLRPEDIEQLEDTKQRWHNARRPSSRRLLFDGSVECDEEQACDCGARQGEPCYIDAGGPQYHVGRRPASREEAR